jgi:hypothetical protein
MYHRRFLLNKGVFLTTLEEIEYGVYKIPVSLPESLYKNKNHFEDIIINSQKRLKSFSKDYDWSEYIKENFANICEIYDDKQEFNRRLKEIFQLGNDVQIPDTYSAFLENKILSAVSPRLYQENFPEGIEDGSYEKLLCHEMAHRFHIRLLDGDEEAMGPVWFFEGFAIYASNQFSDIENNMDVKEIIQIIDEKERGSYKKYSMVFRFVLDKIQLPTLVEKAGDKGFNEWVKNRI